MPHPSHHLPLADVDEALLVDEGATRSLPVGQAAVHALVVDGERRPGAAAVVTERASPELVGAVRPERSARDARYGEGRSSPTPAPRAPGSTRTSCLYEGTTSTCWSASTTDGTALDGA